MHSDCPQAGAAAPPQDSPRRGLSRRDFLQHTALAGAGLALAAGGVRADEPAGDALPTRVLGRTGEEVSILGLGTAPAGEGPPDVQECIRVFAAAIDRGVNYVDAARIYGNAEEALGHLVPSRRERLFLVTKCWSDNAADAEKSLAESLRLMKTDYVDLCHIHHIGNKDLEQVKAEDGILDYLLKEKEAGKIRFIGLSGHAGRSRFMEMIETDQIDVVMTVLNYADRNIYEFESRVLPACRERNVGVVAMKVYAGIRGGFRNHRSAHVGCATDPKYLPHALAYALDLPGVASACVGPYTVEEAIHNVELARQYQPLTPEQRAELLAYGEALAEDLGPRYGPVV